MKAKLWLSLAGAALILFVAQNTGMAGACLSARFHDWRDVGCNPNHAGPGGAPVPKACSDCAKGMPRWWINEPYVNLRLADTPLSYTMSSGQEMAFTFYYKQRYQMPGTDELPTCPLMWSHLPYTESYFRTLIGYGMTNASWGNNWMASLFFWEKYGSNRKFQNGYELLYFNPNGGIGYFYNTNYQTYSNGYVTHWNSNMRDPQSQVQALANSPTGYPTAIIPVADANGIYWGDPQTNGLQLVYPDGSKDVFGLCPYNNPDSWSYNSEGYYALLTQHIDPAGRTTRIGYESGNNGMYFRPRYVVDPDSRTNTFKYVTTNTASINLFRPSEIDDPYGRKALLSYNLTTGFLTNIVDAAGLTNSFTYQSTNTGWITGLTTPYGNTGFSYFDVLDTSTPNSYQQRAIYVSEPEGAQQLYFYQHNTGYVPATGFAPTDIPGQSFDDGNSTGTNVTGHYNLTYRNTFHWGRRQFASLSAGVQTSIAGSLSNAVNNLVSSDYALARCRHWLMDSNDQDSVTEAISSEQDPSPDTAGQIQGLRTWYSYAGKPSPELLGSQPQPSCIARILPDGTDQYTTYNYFPATNTISGAGLASDNETTYSLPDGTIGFLTNSYVYAGNGIDLLSVSNSAGQWIQFAYNTNHQITAITNALKQVTSYSFNANTHNLTNVLFPAGGSVSYTYYPTSSAPTSTSALLQQETHQPEGRSFTINNYQAGNPSSVTDDRGLTTANTWDGLNRLTSASFPDGTSISNVYSRLDLAGVKDRLNNWTRGAYDGLQHLTAVTNANNAVTSYSWCGCGSLDHVVDALANVTYYFYDNQGNPLNIVYPDGSSVTNQFDLAGRKTSVLDGTGRAQQITYNNQNLPVAIANANGTLQSATYDALGRPVIVTDANGITVTNTFDALDELLKTTWPDGISAGYGYSAAGLMAYTNRDGKTMFFGLDGAGRKIAETNANLEVTRLAYDSLNNVTNLLDGNTNPTRWQFNEYGWLTNKVDGLGRNAFRYQYNANGWLMNRTTPEKGNTGYAYDNVGNLTNTAYPTSAIRYTYDLLNRMSTIQDGVLTNWRTYTAVGQLASESNAWTTVGRTYLQGMPATLTIGTNWTQTYNYDFGWRMTNTVSPAGPFSYSYNAIVGQSVPAASALVSSIALPNGATIANSYDGLARLQETDLINYWGHTLDGYTVQRDPLGLITNLVRNLGLTTNSVSIGYDNLAQITSWNAKEFSGMARLNEKISYGFDAAHNLHTRNNGALAQTFTTDAANELTGVARAGTFTLTGATPAPAKGITVNGQPAQLYGDFTFAATNLTLANGNNTFTVTATNLYGVRMTNMLTANLPLNVTLNFDNNGNLTNDGVKSLSYDSENQLTNVTIPSKLRKDFAYDGLNRLRIKREYGWIGGAWKQTNEVRFNWDGNVIVQTCNSNNVSMLTFTRGLDMSGSLQGAGGIGGLLAMTETTGASYYYHHDIGGNVTALMDGAENIVGRAEYDGFNRIINLTGSKTGINPFWQSDQLYHGDIDVVAYLYRPYLPSLQRWANNDPIQELGGINLSRFVGNNPLSWIDPLGLQDDDDKELDARLQVAATGSGMFADLGYGKEEKEKHDQIMCEGKQALKNGAKELGKELATQAVLAATTEGLGNLARAAKLAKVAKGGIGPVIKGTEGVAKSEAAVAARGDIVRGKEVTFELPNGGRTRADLVTESKGNLNIVESKNGPSAQLTARQTQAQQAVQQGQPLIPRGGNAQASGLTPGIPVNINQYQLERH